MISCKSSLLIVTLINYVCLYVCWRWHWLNGRIPWILAIISNDSVHDSEKDRDTSYDPVSLSTKKNGSTVSHSFKITWEKLNKHYL